MRFKLLKEFITFVTERQKIHELRMAGAPPPWTKDPILSVYRFTNVRREDDRVTKWIHKEWVEPHATDYDTLVFAMCLARLVNLPATLELLGYPTRWDPKRFVKIMADVRARGDRAYNNAYMINAVGATKGQSKASYLAECVLTPIWKERVALQATLNEGMLIDLHVHLMDLHGFGGGFMAGQVVADMKWTSVLRAAVDWETFAASGPGSRRGMGWVMDGETRQHWREQEWHDALLALRGQVLPRLPKDLQGLDCQNLQSTLCEFSKYCKVKYLGKRAKQKFKPSEESYV